MAQFTHPTVDAPIRTDEKTTRQSPRGKRTLKKSEGERVRLRDLARYLPKFTNPYCHKALDYIDFQLGCRMATHHRLANFQHLLHVLHGILFELCG